MARHEYDTTNYVIDWDINLANQFGAVSPSTTFEVLEHNSVGASPAPVTLTVTKPALAAPTYTYTQGIAPNSGQLTINASADLDIDAYYIPARSFGWADRLPGRGALYVHHNGRSHLLPVDHVSLGASVVIGIGLCRAAGKRRWRRLRHPAIHHHQATFVNWPQEVGQLNGRLGRRGLSSVLHSAQPF